MSKEKLPGFVPINEVSEHTDAIRIQTLGLPSGLDPDQLELNVKGTLRNARLGGIEKVTLRGVSKDTTYYGYGTSEMTADGLATLSMSRVLSRGRLTEVGYFEDEDSKLPRQYVWGHSVVEINNEEITEKILNDGDSWRRGAVDAFARAHYLNKAVAQGLRKSTNESLFPDPPRDVLRTTWRTAAAYLIIRHFSQLPDLESLGLSFVCAPPLDFFVNAYLKARKGDELPPRKWSTMLEAPLDRFAVASALSYSTKFIRAVPAQTS